jgi:hypothetical protein
MVAYLVEFYRRLAAFCKVRGSYEQPAPARYVGLRGTTLAARRALNNLVHPFALPFERGVLRWSVVPRSFAHIGGGAWSRARSRTLAKVLLFRSCFLFPRFVSHPSQVFTDLYRFEEERE